jgi:hypothetical protein
MAKKQGEMRNGDKNTKKHKGKKEAVGDGDTKEIVPPVELQRTFFNSYTIKYVWKTEIEVMIQVKKKKRK